MAHNITAASVTFEHAALPNAIVLEHEPEAGHHPEDEADGTFKRLWPGSCAGAMAL